MKEEEWAEVEDGALVAVVSDPGSDNESEIAGGSGLERASECVKKKRGRPVGAKSRIKTVQEYSQERKKMEELIEGFAKGGRVLRSPVKKSMIPRTAEIASQQTSSSCQQLQDEMDDKEEQNVDKEAQQDANKLIIESVGQMLKVLEDKVLTRLDEVKRQTHQIKRDCGVTSQSHAATRDINAKN